MSLAPHPAQRSAAWDVAEPRVLADGVLAGHRIIVTGAGTGIGRSIALRLTSLGAHVIGMGRRAEKLQETAALADDGTFSWEAVDLRDQDAARAAVDAAGAGGLHGLVNNAGGQFYAALDDISDNGFRAVVDLNLSAVFTMISAARQHLARQGGAIVNISLSGVDRGSVGMGHSIAARAGVLALTRTVALEWAHDGIRANCIGPGAVLTPGLPQGVIDTLRDVTVPESVPSGRPTPSADVAELAAFLVSDGGRMMTGQLLQVDGGAHLARGLHMLDDWPPAAP